jgi:hypothetical protein
MEQPLIQIGKALVNVSAIAAAKKSNDGRLVIRLLDGKPLVVMPESADAVLKALTPFVNQQAGAPHAVLAEPALTGFPGKEEKPGRFKDFFKQGA